MDDGFCDVGKRGPSALVVGIMVRRLCGLVRCRGSINHCLLYLIIYICVFSCELRELLLIVLAGYLSEHKAIPTR